MRNKKNRVRRGCEEGGSEEGSGNRDGTIQTSSAVSTKTKQDDSLSTKLHQIQIKNHSPQNHHTQGYNSSIKSSSTATSTKDHNPFCILDHLPLNPYGQVIFSYLTCSSLLSLSSTCKEYQQMVWDSHSLILIRDENSYGKELFSEYIINEIQKCAEISDDDDDDDEDSDDSEEDDTRYIPQENLSLRQSFGINRSMNSEPFSSFRASQSTWSMSSSSTFFQQGWNENMLRDDISSNSEDDVWEDYEDNEEENSQEVIIQQSTTNRTTNTSMHNSQHRNYYPHDQLTLDTLQTVLHRRFLHLRTLKLFNLEQWTDSFIPILNSSPCSLRHTLVHLELHDVRILPNSRHLLRLGGGKNCRQSVQTKKKQRKYGRFSKLRAAAANDTTQENKNHNSVNEATFQSNLSTLIISGIIFAPYNTMVQSFTTCSPKLQRLELDGCRAITDEDVHEFMSRLSSSSHSLVDCVSGTSSVVDGSKLTWLSMPNCSLLKEPIFGSYSSQPNIQSSSTPTNMKINTNALQYLNLSKSPCLQRLPQFECPHLTKLNLSYCPQLTNGNLIQAITESCPLLEDLDLTGCVGLESLALRFKGRAATKSDVSSSSIGTRASSTALKRLNLTSCSSLKYIEVNCDSLQSIEMLLCVKLETLRLNLSTIKSLDIVLLYFLKDLYLHAPSLTRLDLSGCHHLCDDHVHCTGGLSKLQSIDICGTSLSMERFGQAAVNDNERKVQVKEGGRMMNWESLGIT